jgi:arginyl-tRNA synthetase
VGDAVSRLLSAAGHEVTREFYINDYGNQVNVLGRSIFARYRQLHGQEIELAKDAYPAEYVVDIAKKIKSVDGDKWLDKPEPEWLDYFTSTGIKENLIDVKRVLQGINIPFDNWFSEQTLHRSGKVAALIEKYVSDEMAYRAEKPRGGEDRVRREDSKAAQYKEQQAGGLFLETTRFGDDEDRIIQRANGTPVYLASDLAYHMDKTERGFDRMIDVFGADHGGHVPRIRAGVAAAGHSIDAFEFILVQMVRLTRNGKELRFSKRAGQIYGIDELVDEIGADAARFIFLMRSANTQFDFDLDLALKQSNDNPVYYVQYGHARTTTMLKRAESEGCGFDASQPPSVEHLARLTLPEEREMLKKIGALSDVIQGAAQACEPHRLVYFCQELISEFHGYFTRYKKTERVISDDVELTLARLSLVAAVKQTLKNTLMILGISAPDHMEAPVVQDEEE